MRHFLALSLFLALPNVSLGETHYVNNIAGSDTNSGVIDDNQGDGVGPLRTINAALKRAQRGDRIVLANTGAYYEECITLQGARHSGYEFEPFTIEGNGATLDGSALVPPHKWDVLDENIYRFVPERGGYQQLFLDGELAERMPRIDGSYLSASIEPKQWYRVNGGINFAAGPGKTPNSYDLRYAKHRVGITLYDVKRVVIRDLNVRGFQLDGINAHDNAFDCVLSEVTCTENGRSGVSIGGASRVRIFDSNLRDNGEMQLNADGWSTTNLYRTRLVSNEAPVWVRSTNDYGRGARLYINDALQQTSNGWMTREDKALEDVRQDRDELEKSDDLPGDMDREATEDEAAEDATVPANADADLAPAEETPVEDDPFRDDPFGNTEPEAAEGNADDGDLFDDGSDAMDDDPFSDEI